MDWKAKEGRVDAQNLFLKSNCHPKMSKILCRLLQNNTSGRLSIPSSSGGNDKCRGKIGFVIFMTNLPASSSPPIKLSALCTITTRRNYIGGYIRLVKKKAILRRGYGLVWGKAKSHPWWPVKFTIPLSPRPWLRDLVESKKTVSRNFGDAVKDAVEEVGRRATLGLICYCINSFNSTPRDGYAMVAIPGYENLVIYTHRKIKEARDGFSPEKMLGFMQRMAVSPWSTEDRTISWIKSAV
eukprot:Gb_00722 [translate_table: standard]